MFKWANGFLQGNPDHRFVWICSKREEYSKVVKLISDATACTPQPYVPFTETSSKAVSPPPYEQTRGKSQEKSPYDPATGDLALLARAQGIIPVPFSKDNMLKAAKRPEEYGQTPATAPSVMELTQSLTTDIFTSTPRNPALEEFTGKKLFQPKVNNYGRLGHEPWSYLTGSTAESVRENQRPSPLVRAKDNMERIIRDGDNRAEIREIFNNIDQLVMEEQRENTRRELTQPEDSGSERSASAENNSSDEDSVFGDEVLETGERAQGDPGPQAELPEESDATTEQIARMTINAAQENARKLEAQTRLVLQTVRQIPDQVQAAVLAGFQTQGGNNRQGKQQRPNSFPQENQNQPQQQNTQPKRRSDSGTGYVSPEEWNQMTPQQRLEIRERRLRAQEQGTQGQNSQTQGNFRNSSQGQNRSSQYNRRARSQQNQGQGQNQSQDRAPRPQQNQITSPQGWREAVGSAPQPENRSQN
ncbi:hypothetical protein WMY93_002412 [Mugilogobius chulae]|uniref:Gag protein n=1 Tax=Mugilogobius chulae TaxID=88201 RepID=A0AAW0PTS0_9GOBI